MLTEPGLKSASRGTLVFAREGSYLIQRDGLDGPIVAEIVSGQPGGRLSVEAGRYHVSERNREYLGQGSFTVAAGGATTVAADSLRRVEYARVVRKGASEVTRSWGLFASFGMRGELLALGPAWGGVLGARADFRPASIELRLSVGRSATANNRLGILSVETGVSLVGLHVFDVGPISLGVGVEAGAAFLEQRFSDELAPARHSLSALLAPLFQVEVPVGRRLYARVEGAYLTYFLASERAAGASAIGT